MKPKKYDVYAIGNAVVDIEYQVDECLLHRIGVEKGMMTLVDQVTQQKLMQQLQQQGLQPRRFAGGSAANTLALVAALGNSGFYCGCLADDDLAEVFRQDFQQFHAVTKQNHTAVINSHAKNITVKSHVYAGQHTGHCIVCITPDAERTMLTFLGVNAQFDVHDIDFSALEQSRYLYIEGYMVAQDAAFAGVKKAIDFAKNQKIPVGFSFSDPSMVRLFPQRLAELMAMRPDLLFCNADEALAYTQTHVLDQALSQLTEKVPHVVVTSGHQGAHIAYWHQQQKKIEHIPAQTVKAIDTTGAGDAFAGAYLHGVIHGWSSARSATFAHQVAAYVVQQHQARLDQETALQLLHAS